MPIRKILYPVDFSPNCERSAKFVEYVTRQYRAELTLLHVTEASEHAFALLEVSGAVTDELRAQWLDRSRRRLEGFVKEEMPELAPKQVITEGNAAREIVKYADANGIDLIMMPTHGFSLMRRFVLGSTTARVLHDAHCPVWTGVHTDEPIALEAIPFRHLMCAVDLREKSEATIQYAAKLAAEFEADLHVTHASPVIVTPPEICVQGDLTERFAREAREELTKMLARLGVKAGVCVHPGDPAEVIREAAKAHRSNLLVVARGAATGGLGRLRAHSYSIINQAPCSVISV